MSLTVDTASRTADIALPRQEPAPAQGTNPQNFIADGIRRLLEAASGSPQAQPATRELVASEDSVDAGIARDAYDLNLYRETDGSYTLEMEMNIEFSFQEGVGDDGLPLGWSDAQKQEFMRDYVAAVEGTWDGHNITLDDGTQVRLDVQLNVSEERSGFFGGVLDAVDGSEHWNIDVTRVPEGGFRQSSITPSRNYGDFDSEDVNPIDKGASDPQVGAAHEFGHMIGLEDEYNGNAGAEAQKDTDSVMHTGDDVRERHLDLLEDWVDGQI
jgi:hypothetical protein